MANLVDIEDGDGGLVARNKINASFAKVDGLVDVVGNNNLKKFQVLVNKSVTATSSDQPNICVVGDSITQNAGATNVHTGYPRLLKNAFDLAYGISGWGYRGYQEFANDGTWEQLAEGTALNTWKGTPSSDNITLKGTFSRLEIIYATKAGASTFNVKIDGVNTVVDCDGVESYHNVAVKDLGVSSLSHTVIVEAPTSGEVYIEGLVFHAQSPGVQVQQLGHPGIRATDYKDNPTAIKATIEDFNPILTTIMLGTNDHGNQEALDDFKAGLEQLVASAKVSGDVMLMAMAAPQVDSVITYQEYVDVIELVAKETDSEFINIYERWFKSWTWADDNGFMIDTVHPIQPGRSDIARVMIERLVNKANLGIFAFLTSSLIFDGQIGIDTNDLPIVTQATFSAREDVTEGLTSITIPLIPWQPNSAYGVLVSPNWMTTFSYTTSYNQIVINFGTAAPANARMSWKVLRD